MYFGDEKSSSNASLCSDVNEEMNCNVICMSEAGKPIYARFGSDEEVARTCGLIQALRLSLLDPRMRLGDIQSLSSGKLKMAFMNVHSITLVAVAKRDGEVMESEAYLRMQLEHVYGEILLTLTEQVQSVFLQNPNFDLAESLGTAGESLITDVLNQASPSHGTSCGSFLAGGIESVFPIAPEVRDNASRVLFEIGQNTDNTVFALLIAGDKKLLSIVQPRHVPHQLSAFDLHLLLHFVHTRPGLLTSELWFPICLPRFNSSGFLYTYTNCLDHNTQLTLVLLSQQNTTEQFQLFRHAATVARENLGLPQKVGNVLRIINQEQAGAASVDDVAWKRSLDHEDYVDASLEGGDEMIPYVFKDSPPVRMNKSTMNKKSILLDELEGALSPQVTSEILKECCDIAHAKHFLFRLDAPVQTDQAEAGKVAQCLSSSLDTHFADAHSKRRVYSMYQKLQWRMRLGSATCDSTLNSFDKMSYARAASEENHMKGIGQHCPASCLVESPPSVQGVTSVIDGPELFVAMNGREFEV